MFKRSLALAAVTAPLVIPQAAQALQPTRPATSTAPSSAPVALRATITAVQGMVQVREGDAENIPWKLAKVGMIVGEGAEFRTGLKSAVQIVIPPSQTLTLDRLGTVKLLELIRDQNKIKTDVGMKYGRVRFGVEKAGLEHDARIHSPGSTLAVRGTLTSLTDDGLFPPQAVSITGKVTFTDSTGQVDTFGGTSTTTIVSASDGAAGNALNQTVTDPSVALARSPGEENAIQTTSVNSGFSFGPVNIGGVTGTTTPPPPPVADIGQGSLIFQLAWVGSDPKGATPDLDLFVLSPRGELLCPKNCATAVASGGRSPTDDRGGKQSVGSEFASWANSFPLGNYSYGINHVSGPAGEFVIAVIQNGQQIGETDTGSLSSKDNAVNFSVQIAADSTTKSSTAANQKTSKAAGAPARQSRSPATPQRQDARRSTRK